MRYRFDADGNLFISDFAKDVARRGLDNNILLLMELSTSLDLEYSSRLHWPSPPQGCSWPLEHISLHWDTWRRVYLLQEEHFYSHCCCSAGSCFEAEVGLVVSFEDVAVVVVVEAKGHWQAVAELPTSILYLEVTKDSYLSKEFYCWYFVCTYSVKFHLPEAMDLSSLLVSVL